MSDGKVQVDFGGLFHKWQERVIILGKKNISLFKKYNEKGRNDPSESFFYHTITPYEGEEGNSFYILTKKDERIYFRAETKEIKNYIFIKLKSLHYSYISEYYLSDSYLNLEKTICPPSLQINDYSSLQANTMLLFPQVITDLKDAMNEFKPIIEKKTHLKDIYMDFCLKFTAIVKEMELRFGNINSLTKKIIEEFEESNDKDENDNDPLNKTEETIDHLNISDDQIVDVSRKFSTKSNFLNNRKRKNVENQKPLYFAPNHQNSKNEEFSLCSSIVKKKDLSIQTILQYKLLGQERNLALKGFVNSKIEQQNVFSYQRLKKENKKISNTEFSLFPLTKQLKRFQFSKGEIFQKSKDISKTLLLIEQQKSFVMNSISKFAQYEINQENDISIYNNRKHLYNLGTTVSTEIS